MIVLGIESSCDETAAAVVADGHRVLSSVVASQVAVHQPYGGVVPELASRHHLETIGPVVRQAIDDAEVDEAAIDGVAVTRGPGLVGALLVGFCFARAWAWAKGIPYVGIDHLEGHIHSVFLAPDPPPFPFVALLVSGGHTSLYHVTGPTQMSVLGRTRDDAAGEAFDKVAKLMALGYPGGGVIGRLAETGAPAAIAFPRALLEPGSFDFSFSGLKSAVARYVAEHPDALTDGAADVAAGFQEAVVDVLVAKLLAAAEHTRCSHMALVGGVAANARLRTCVADAATRSGRTIHLPPLDLCGDNAAMIAAVGYHYLARGQSSPLVEDVFSTTRTGINKRA